MTDFFGNLNQGGIRLPEARINDGGMLPPLSTAGYGGGLDGSADARINTQSSLLGDIAPYVYGTSDRLTTQTAYLNTPHNIQKIIPQIMLPDCGMAAAEHTFLLPHAVSDGDIAFAIRFVTTAAQHKFMSDVHTYMRQGAARAIDYICNITTVNYMLRGLQSDVNHLNPAWKHFATALGGTSLVHAYNHLQKAFEDKNDDNIKKFRKKLAVIMFRDICRPIGVVIGSDKQGGQHQGSNKAVTWPVDFVATISIDGRNENLCNFWKSNDVNSGDELLLQLVDYENTKVPNTYTLNNHKYTVHKEFMQGFTGAIFQVCPVTKPKLFSNAGAVAVVEMGYWHFAMSQKMHRMRTDYASVTEIEQFHRGGLLQVTISPHFVRDCCCEDPIIAVPLIYAMPFNKSTNVLKQHAQPVMNRPFFMQQSSQKAQLESKRRGGEDNHNSSTATQKRCKFTFSLPVSETRQNKPLNTSQQTTFKFTSNRQQETPLQLPPQAVESKKRTLVVDPKFATVGAFTSETRAVVPSVTKGRVKATRLAADPSAADVSENQKVRKL